MPNDVLSHVGIASVLSNDTDPLETREWLDSFEAVLRHLGPDRAAYLLKCVCARAQELGVPVGDLAYWPYCNTIPLDKQAVHPGNVELEERLVSILRWNALAMVARANKTGELGGHIASYASAAEIFEVGFNHFFRGPQAPQGADLVFFQPHSAPGVYARAYLEGRLEEEQLAHYRREVQGKGLSSYPHPWLMPHFWQFPTGSMGLGPINAIYQARFMRYLENRGLAKMSERHVWGIFGDGEMDEPDSIGALTLAARERLDNLTFVINCNLQRLDGPVRGNGQIIRELELLFAGAGWNVIKVLWGSEWDPLFARDTSNALLRRLTATVDGQFQTLGANDGAYNEQHFFASDVEVRKLIAHMSHQQIDALRRGGHDLRKLYAAFAAARGHVGRPTIILAKTKKGYGMGKAGESRMTSHQEKKLDREALIRFRDRFQLPLSDQEMTDFAFYSPPAGSPEIEYLRQRRADLGGSLPDRSSKADVLRVPPIESYALFALEAADKSMSTTMAMVRVLTALLRDKSLGPRIVPIVADEARTFGMASLFRQIGIYSPSGQLYEPEDAQSMLSYREKHDGQMLEEGITEAGALSSWIAAATSYSVHGMAMLPVYIFYSMFGFQRVGDLIWAAADQRARGFLIGATAGRTTLAGEGLQHQDGASQVMAATVPNCRAYDPAFAAELAVILDHGARQMLEAQQDVFYYITVTNENYPHPTLPEVSRDAVIRGMHRISRTEESAADVHLLGSGAILREVIEAARLLTQWHIVSCVWSVTSFSELTREARDVERNNRLHPLSPPRVSYVADCLSDGAPVVAATDYVCAYPQLLGTHISNRFITLGTDGFGRSDTRAQLRRFFEIDSRQIAVTALYALCLDGRVSNGLVAEAIKGYEIDCELPPPWTR